jgi:alpha-D-ribose 1-methylphosphonate 5-triphosphate diphosphatase
MTNELILTNARLVTPDDVLVGTVLVRAGKIADIVRGATAIRGALDCEGDYLLPGLVELHTDNLEKHISPRPGVRWPADAAILAHDAQMAAAGVTTVFDAVSLGDMIEGSSRQSNLASMIDAIGRTKRNGHLRADHRLHLRCEVSSDEAWTLFEAFADDENVAIVSLMDHTPGQRQFTHEDKYREYYMGKYGFDDAQMEAFTARQLAASARNSTRNRQAIAAASRARGLILASHDDATLDHVDEAVALGTHFSEFPTTVGAAKAARDKGMRVLMGAPNVVRGGSHSGNVSAAELAAQGCLDVLSSDYVPVSLMQAIFMLHRGSHAIPLPQAVAMVTAIPAEVAGLSDRGHLVTWQRADLVRVHEAGPIPVIREVWREGRRII